MPIPKRSCQFLLALLIQLLAALWYWEQNDLPWARFGVFVLDAAGKSLTAVFSMALLERIWTRRHTPALFFAYTVLLYHQNSVLKFSVDQLFDGFLRDDRERLLGGFLVDGAILLGIGVLYRWVRAKNQHVADRAGKAHWREITSVTEETLAPGSGCRLTKIPSLGKGRLPGECGILGDNMAEAAGLAAARNAETKGRMAAAAGMEEEKKSILLGLAAAGSFAAIRLGSLALTGRPISMVTGRTMRTVWEGLTDLVYLSLVLSWGRGERSERGKQSGNGICPCGNPESLQQPERKSERAGWRPQSVLPVLPFVIVGLVQGLTTLRTGSKQALAGFALYGVLALLVTGRIRVRELTGLLIVSPLVLCLLTGVSEKTSGRLSGYPDRFVMQYHAFRYDLSDLAVTIADRQIWREERTSWEENRNDRNQMGSRILEMLSVPPEHALQEGIAVVREALEMSVPSVLSGKREKQEELTAYPDQLSRLGLCPEQDDYNDTPFSMGAQIFGYPGIFLVFAVMLLLLDVMGAALESGLRRVLRDSAGGTKGMNLSDPGTIALLLILPYALQAEGDWFMWVYRTRDFGVEMGGILLALGITIWIQRTCEGCLPKEWSKEKTQWKVKEAKKENDTKSGKGQCH